MVDQPIFTLNNVCYAYKGGIPGLTDITFQVQQGECWAILGANGSGKSTLLKLLDGLYFATQGTLLAFGQELSETALDNDAVNYAFRRRVGFVFQDADAQLFSPSVKDEVAFAPLQLGLPDDEVTKRINESLDALEISKLAERPPHHLSGGEKKRVALASVLSLRPEVWLLDEPTAGLDPRSQSRLVQFIRQRHAASETIVIATHDLSIIEQVATHCLILDENHHIAAIGQPAEILADHRMLHACNLIHEHSPASATDRQF